MMHPTVDFKNYLKPGIRAYIWPASAAYPCAPWPRSSGVWVCVQGSDMTESETVKHLRNLGIPVSIGHSRRESAKCPAGDPHSRHPR